jgi:hypothetical protein
MRYLHVPSRHNVLDIDLTDPGLHELQGVLGWPRNEAYISQQTATIDNQTTISPLLIPLTQSAYVITNINRLSQITDMEYKVIHAAPRLLGGSAPNELSVISA